MVIIKKIKINTIYEGDCLEVLKTFPNECVDMVITSPPYYGLRDYGVEGQIGLEKTFEEYLNNLIAIFNDVKRVLKPAGTCWVNLGDSYSSHHETGTTDIAKGWKSKGNAKHKSQAKHGRANGGNIPTKSLMQIPSRFAIMMSDNGWILRNEIIWHKPNCMPSSVKDRFTVDYEKLFFFTKSKKYYFEQQKEPMKTTDVNPPNPIDLMRNKRAVWSINTKPLKETHFATFPEELIETPIKAGCPEGGIVLDIFMGSGTTGVVAKKLNRNFIGIELNQEYIKMANRRISNVFYQSSLF